MLSVRWEKHISLSIKKIICLAKVKTGFAPMNLLQMYLWVVRILSAAIWIMVSKKHSVVKLNLFFLPNWIHSVYLVWSSSFFKLYLVDMQRYVSLDDVITDKSLFAYHVPQGFISGLLFFLLMIFPHALYFLFLH